MNYQQTIKYTILSLALATASLPAVQAKDIYRNPKQPVEKRVDDLMKRMTLEEKVAQMSQFVGIEHMKNAAFAISPEEMKKSHAMGFYANYPPEEIEEMTRKGWIGSFLHVVSAKEANHLQSLAAKSRLGIPLLIGIDAVHGNGMVKGTTIYPTCIGQAASFNPALVEKMSHETALEMRATGSHWTFTPNVEVARDARWGRVGETFGEDPYLVGLMGVATVKGFQQDDFGKPGGVIACAKHLVGGGQSINGINGAPLDVSQRTLMEIFLPPFKACVDAGVYTVMPAHNEMNGTPCHASKYLMTDLLRGEWGFNGFYVSDWMDVERLEDYHRVAESLEDAFLLSVDAGLDLNMHGPDFFFGVVKLVKEGRLPESRIDQAVRKILAAKFKMGLFENPYVDEKDAPKVLFNKEHQQTALELARQSIVLLKNDGLLPLDASKYKNVLVTGPNVHNQSILGDWALQQPEENVITIYDGLKQLRPDINFNLVDFGWNIRKMQPTQVDKAVQQGKENDLVIVAVGENSMRYHWMDKTCGENSDRYDISLFGLQQELVERLQATGTPVVVILVNGRPLATEWIADNVPALVEAWEPGAMGGQALAEILFGEVNPSAKLPITIPRHSGQIQTYYNYKFTSKWFKYATGNSTPLYDFGYGLSYTTFGYGDVTLSRNEIGQNETVKAVVEVTNIGNRVGDEVVQLYITDDYSSATRPVKELKDFKRITLQPGETRKVEFDITPDKLAYYDANMQYGVEPGTFTVRIGSSSRNNDLKKASFRVK